MNKELIKYKTKQMLKVLSIVAVGYISVVLSVWFILLLIPVLMYKPIHGDTCTWSRMHNSNWWYTECGRTMNTSKNPKDFNLKYKCKYCENRIKVN